MRTSDTARCSSLERWLRSSSVVALVAAVFMIIGTLPAGASCGLLPGAKLGRALEPPSLPAQQGQPASAPRHTSIVGLWHVILTKSAGSGGGRLWQSFQQFHADGLEMENADISPIGSNVCMGVWKKAGSGTVKIYHVAWTFDATGAPNGSDILTETNHLGKDGNSFTGTFDIQFYDASGQKVTEYTGSITATRIDFSHHFTPPSTP